MDSRAAQDLIYLDDDDVAVRALNQHNAVRLVDLSPERFQLPTTCAVIGQRVRDPRHAARKLRDQACGADGRQFSVQPV
jgi:hypothetical protein